MNYNSLIENYRKSLDKEYSTEDLKQVEERTVANYEYGSKKFDLDVDKSKEFEDLLVKEKAGNITAEEFSKLRELKKDYSRKLVKKSLKFSGGEDRKYSSNYKNMAGGAALGAAAGLILEVFRGMLSNSPEYKRIEVLQAKFTLGQGTPKDEKEFEELATKLKKKFAKQALKGAAIGGTLGYNTNRILGAADGYRAAKLSKTEGPILPYMRESAEIWHKR